MTNVFDNIWTKLIGSSKTEQATDIAIDGNNEFVYITGYSEGTFEDLINSNDAFLRKFDSNGNQIWSKFITSSGGYRNADNAYGMAIDNHGFIYITGSTGGNLDDQINNGSGDAFITKFDSNGNRNWTRLIGSESRLASESANDVAIDNDGYIYITGGTREDLDGQINRGSTDIFVTKFDIAGNKKWTRLIASYEKESAESSSSITAGNDGYLYIAGDTEGNHIQGSLATFKDDTGYVYDTSNKGKKDICITKFDSNGNKIFTRLIGSIGDDRAEDICTDNNGNLYIVGYITGDIYDQQGNGSKNAFISKLDSDGNKKWLRFIGTTSDDYAESISIGSDGFLYVKGTTYGNTDKEINNSVGAITEYGARTPDIFISQFDTDGNNKWTKLIGTSGNEYAYGITNKNDGSILIAGSTTGNLDGEINSGRSDIFIKSFRNIEINGKEVRGTQSNDFLQGTSDNDYIYGFNGNDILEGKDGNDVLDSGEGSDTAAYSGKFSNYSFSRETNSLRITDQRIGANEGTDTLKNIEYIQFTDQTVEESKVDVSKSFSGNFRDYKFYNKGNGVYQIKTDSGYDDITGIPKLLFADKTTGISAITDIKGTFDQVTGLNTDSGEMFRLYNAAFARFPDADGLKYWIDQFSSGKNTRRVVAQSFLGSAEFTEKYGSNVSDETYVNNLYKNVLGRDADTEGLNYWVGNLSSGLETRYEALLGFAESAENKALFTEMTGFG